MIKKDSSFAALFTAVCLSIIGFITLTISLIFFTNLRSIAYKQAETGTKETINRVQNEVLGKLQEWASFITYTAIGVAPVMSQEPADTQALERMFKRVVDAQSDVWLLYGSNNQVWNQEGGYMVYHDGTIPPDTLDNTRRSWYLNAKANPGKAAYTEPFRSASTGRFTISISANVYDDRRRDVGVISANVSIDFLETLLRSGASVQSQKLYLINKEGLFITHPEEGAIMARNFFDETGLEQYRNDILSSPVFSHIDKEAFIYSALIPGVDWILVSAIPVSVIFSEADRLLFRLILITIGMLLAATVISMLFTHKMLTVPIREIERVAGGLARMDFTVDIKKFRTDELGRIQRALIQIRDSLKQGIDDIHQEHLSRAMESGKRLNTVVAESFDAIELIIQDTDKVDTKANTQMESVAVAADSVSSIVKHTDSFKQTVHNQADCIARSSAVIEQMVANIASIRSVVAGTTKTTDTLSKSSETGHKMLLKLTEELKNIGEQSVTLQSANKTIADIAGETNILAMNAAIEAAHAGESGKGFAVVAGEVRKLAELAGKESEAISAEIKKMERAIEQIGEVSKETVGAMDLIFREINAMNSSFAAVNQAVEEQAAGGSQILTSLKSVHGMTEQVQDGAGFIHEQSGTIQGEMEKLQRISQEVTAIVYEMRLAGGSISSFLDEAKELANAGFPQKRRHF
ncbi:MAG: methyl-accepting chemotaxis protein [Treponema sp.]|jgi:methyl-accepting chemotaxis protein|nr:methyl-accepting chemotaxis protein [Treponema sp.]